MGMEQAVVGAGVGRLHCLPLRWRQRNEASAVPAPLLACVPPAARGPLLYFNTLGAAPPLTSPPFIPHPNTHTHAQSHSTHPPTSRWRRRRRRHPGAAPLQGAAPRRAAAVAAALGLPQRARARGLPAAAPRPQQEPLHLHAPRPAAAAAVLQVRTLLRLRACGCGLAHVTGKHGVGGGGAVGLGCVNVDRVWTARPARETWRLSHAGGLQGGSPGVAVAMARLPPTAGHA